MCNFCDDDAAKVHCDNCDWTGIAADLEGVSDLWERLDAGCEVPAGQCPECGALAYLSEKPAWARNE